MGYGESRVHVTSGMIIRPDFYCESRTSIGAAELEKLNLDPDRPTGIVMFGGHGSRVMQPNREAARRHAAHFDLRTQRGARAAAACDDRGGAALGGRLHLQDPRLHAAERFLHRQARPGSISEAVQQGLPVVVVLNTWTMPQERYNAEWVKENNAGIVLDSFRFVRGGVAEITSRLDEFRASIARIEIAPSSKYPRFSSASCTPSRRTILERPRRESSRSRSAQLTEPRTAASNASRH